MRTSFSVSLEEGDPSHLDARLNITPIHYYHDDRAIRARSGNVKATGQLQFQESSNGQTVQAAHSVALLRAEFTDDGKVTGSSPENGCQMLGVWSAGGQTLNWIDITFSHCSYLDLNRRYHGSLILARPDTSGNLVVQSIGAAFSKDQAKVFDIKGTLRR